MSKQRLRLAENRLAQHGAGRGKPVSQILLDHGTVAPRVMLGALAESARIKQPVANVIAAEGIAQRRDILAAQAERHGAMPVLGKERPPDPAVQSLLPASFCLKHAVLPWMRIGDTLVLATARPDDFDDVMEQAPDTLGPVMMAVTLEEDIHAAISQSHGAALARAAETWRPPSDSCRDINQSTTRTKSLGVGALLLVFALLWLYPAVLFAAALGLALISLVAAQGLKVVAFLASRKQEPFSGPPALPEHPPTVSVLVPLFRESEIASTLVQRLSRLDYPRSLLDVVLVLEAGDAQTKDVIAKTALPPWFRVIEVPDGPIMTKPRALNYALHFTKGDIIGVYDAEDAPAPDQIGRVVDHFSRAPPDVACLQGILDFYNPMANWLSRCFAIEYASWFRVVLPGLSRLGLAVPLGGTTLFFRRQALVDLHGWDAHNVTEDADLGILLARRGYRTELIASVTREEANNRFWPWIKQRSRWLKGYAITWWVHSRRPLALWRDLGPKKFLGMQVLFVTTIVQFTLAPLLWSFWLVLFGLPHPLDAYLGPTSIAVLTALFLGAEAVAILIGIAAVSRSPHERLIPWVPTLFAYFPLGTFAIYKGLFEMLTNRAFYWDKTTHGTSQPDSPDIHPNSGPPW